jgi:sterol desaturase/sphingolipid hydroxylase (fatty acid hydroxylase superfamily)
MNYAKEFMSQRLILFLTAVFVLSCCGFLATPIERAGAVAISIGAGVVFVIIVEYVVHRFVLHEFPWLIPYAYRGHVAHHEKPTDVNHLFGPVSIDFVGYLIVLGGSYALTGNNWNLTFAVMVGASCFQIYYQWKHYVSHRPITPITPWGKWLKKKHLLHHYMDENSWYGVSNPVLDILLGTNKPDASAKVKAKTSAPESKGDMSAGG